MQIWCLQSKCVTIIQNYDLLYFIGLYFPFYRFLYCFAVCYKKIFSQRSGALIAWIGKVSLKIFLKADIFGVDALDKSFMPNGFSVVVKRSF